MKKIVLFLACLLLSTFAIMAQEPTLTVPTDGWTGFFTSLAAIVPLVTFLAAYINKMVKATGFWKQAVSWLVAILCSAGGTYFKLGIFAGLIWWQIIVYGVGIGLVANGFFDIKMVQAILAFIGAGKAKPVKP